MKGLTARRVDFLPEFFAARGGPEWAIDASTNQAGPNDRRPASVPGGHRPRLTLHELQRAWRTDGPIAVSTTSAPCEPSIRIHAALRRGADCLKGLHSFSHHVFDIGGSRRAAGSDVARPYTAFQGILEQTVEIACSTTDSPRSVSSLGRRCGPPFVATSAITTTPCVLSRVLFFCNAEVAAIGQQGGISRPSQEVPRITNRQGALLLQPVRRRSDRPQRRNFSESFSETCRFRTICAWLSVRQFLCAIDRALFRAQQSYSVWPPLSWLSRRE